MKKLNIKMSRFFLKDVLKFKDQAKNRNKVINSFPPAEDAGSYHINDFSKELHPDYQKMVISKITEHPDSDAKTYELKKKDGSKAAIFRAGQYVTINLKIGTSFVSRPYSISSSPLESQKGLIEITVKRVQDGFVSPWILDNWTEGDSVLISAPEGQFYYERLRDRKQVVAVAGGSGITPFLSMARAIKDGLEDFNLTILYGSRNEKSILLKDELNEVASATDKVKIIHVLSEEKKEGYESGFITSDLISKYGNDDYSIFVCGPSAMYSFVKEEIKKLNKPLRETRFELQGLSKNPSSYKGYPTEIQNKVFNITVHLGMETFTIKALGCETILTAIEKAGLNTQSRCRSGTCSWCRSKLLKGKTFIPEENDGRRFEDKAQNYIHPCAAFPLSDLEIECSEGLNLL